MKGDLFQGKLVRLAAQEVQPMAEAFSKWSGDSEYWRLMDSGSVRPFSVKTTKEWIEKNQEKEKPDQFSFAIRTLEDDRLIGDIGLDGIQWTHGDTFVGIGLGERDYLGQGLRHGRHAGDPAFCIYRAQPAPRLAECVCIQSAGHEVVRKGWFKYEGRMRQMLHREGKHWDIVFMGILGPRKNGKDRKMSRIEGKWYVSKVMCTKNE